MVKLIKIEDLKWNATVNGEIVGNVKRSVKYGGSYEATLNNGVVVWAFNQNSLKSMILKGLNK